MFPHHLLKNTLKHIFTLHKQPAVHGILYTIFERDPFSLCDVEMIYNIFFKFAEIEFLIHSQTSTVQKYSIVKAYWITLDCKKKI